MFDTTVAYTGMRHTTSGYKKLAEINGFTNDIFEVKIDDKSIISGDINGDKIYISKLAKINGVLNANNGVTFWSNIENNNEDKIRRFKSNLDKIEGL